MTNPGFAFPTAILAAYLLGSLPTAYVLVRLVSGADIRELGSRNVGATNAGRVLGRWGFVVALTGDVAKGALAVVLAQWIWPDDLATWTAVPTVIAGHVWPVTLRFRGGKGVGPGIGALAVADVSLLVIVLGIFGAMFLATRRYQLSGLSSIAVLPLITIVLRSNRPIELIVVSLTVALVLLAHREDLREFFAKRGAANG